MDKDSDDEEEELMLLENDKDVQLWRFFRGDSHNVLVALLRSHFT